MRALVIALVIGTATGGCGGKQPGTAGGGGSGALVFPAARYVPAQPTYVFSAHTMRDAQVAFTSIVEMFGMSGGFEVSEVARELSKVLGVDPMSPEAVANIGVDLEGNVALFSEDFNPTFVVHLRSPDSMNSFLEGQRERLRTQSVISGGTEVFTAKLDSEIHVSWAVEKEWLWLHFALGGADGIDWFEHSKRPAGSGWVEGWKWAQQIAAKAPAVVGLMDLSGTLAKIGVKEPEAMACARQLAIVKRMAFNFEADLKHIAAHMAFDLGDESGRVTSTLLPPPPGWGAASANAPLSAQWNSDLRAAAAWIEPCFGEGDLRATLDQFGIRTARAFVHKLDPDDKDGVGAVSLDLSSSAFIRAQLDQIPGRGTFEKSRTYGAYKGKHLSVPFVGKGDYVLDDKMLIASMGDGLLEQIGGGAASGSPMVVDVTVRPAGLSADVWAYLAAQLSINDSKRFAQRLLLWSELHFGGHLEGTTLMIDAHGNRR